MKRPDQHLHYLLDTVGHPILYNRGAWIALCWNRSASGQGMRSCAHSQQRRVGDLSGYVRYTEADRGTLTPERLLIDDSRVSSVAAA